MSKLIPIKGDMVDSLGLKPKHFQIPSMADLLVMYSTYEGAVLWRWLLNEVYKFALFFKASMRGVTQNKDLVSSRHYVMNLTKMEKQMIYFGC